MQQLSPFSSQSTGQGLSQFNSEQLWQHLSELSSEEAWQHLSQLNSEEAWQQNSLLSSPVAGQNISQLSSEIQSHHRAHQGSRQRSPRRLRQGSSQRSHESSQQLAELGSQQLSDELAELSTPRRLRLGSSQLSQESSPQTLPQSGLLPTTPSRLRQSSSQLPHESSQQGSELASQQLSHGLSELSTPSRLRESSNQLSQESSQVLSELGSQQLSHRFSELSTPRRLRQRSNQLSQESSQQLTELGSQQVSELASQQLSHGLSELSPPRRLRQRSNQLSQESSQQRSELQSQQASELDSQQLSDEVSELSTPRRLRQGSSQRSHESSQQLTELGSQQLSDELSELSTPPGLLQGSSQLSQESSPQSLPQSGLLPSTPPRLGQSSRHFSQERSQLLSQESSEELSELSSQPFPQHLSEETSQQVSQHLSTQNSQPLWQESSESSSEHELAADPEDDGDGHRPDHLQAGADQDDDHQQPQEAHARSYPPRPFYVIADALVLEDHNSQRVHPTFADVTDFHNGRGNHAERYMLTIFDHSADGNPRTIDSPPTDAASEEEYRHLAHPLYGRIKETLDRLKEECRAFYACYDIAPTTNHLHVHVAIILKKKWYGRRLLTEFGETTFVEVMNGSWEQARDYIRGLMDPIKPTVKRIFAIKEDYSLILKRTRKQKFAELLLEDPTQHHFLELTESPEWVCFANEYSRWMQWIHARWTPPLVNRRDVVKTIYIAGESHSGKTTLSLYLITHPKLKGVSLGSINRNGQIVGLKDLDEGVVIGEVDFSNRQVPRPLFWELWGSTAKILDLKGSQVEYMPNKVIMNSVSDPFLLEITQRWASEEVEQYCNRINVFIRVIRLPDNNRTFHIERPPVRNPDGTWKDMTTKQLVDYLRLNNLW